MAMTPTLEEERDELRSKVRRVAALADEIDGLHQAIGSSLMAATIRRALTLDYDVPQADGVV